MSNGMAQGSPRAIDGERPGQTARSSTVKLWLEGARPRTLPAAITPVLVGTGVAAAEEHPIWTRVVLALVVALALQVGVNFANDYSDGIRGTDAARVGPLRMVASGLVRPKAVLTAALVCFAIAGVTGFALVAVAHAWLLLLMGFAAIIAAWTYTGGPRPYGYHALGEVGVFLFFGLAAVMGTAYVQAGKVTTLLVMAAVAIGLLACSLLMVNNVRDIAGDAQAGKRTLAVLLGERRARRSFAVLLLVPCVIAMGIGLWHPWALLSLLALPLAYRPLRTVMSGETGRALIPALRDTGRTELLFGVLMTVGLFLS